jgi:hypothetical protein
MQSIVCGHDFISIPRYGSFFRGEPFVRGIPQKKTASTDLQNEGKSWKFGLQVYSDNLFSLQGCLLWDYGKPFHTIGEIMFLIISIL